MRKPTQKYSKEAEATLLEIKDQKKLRSDAIARLKACALEVKSGKDDLQRGPQEPPAAINGKALATTQERAAKARRALKEGLAALKRTTVQTMQQIKETTLYSAEELRKRLEGELEDLGGNTATA